MKKINYFKVSEIGAPARKWAEDFPHENGYAEKWEVLKPEDSGYPEMEIFFLNKGFKVGDVILVHHIW